MVVRIEGCCDWDRDVDVDALYASETVVDLVGCDEDEELVPSCRWGRI